MGLKEYEEREHVSCGVLVQHTGKFRIALQRYLIQTMLSVRTSAPGKTSWT